MIVRANKIIYGVLLTVVLYVLIIGCHDNSQLSYALNFAGDNRGELEKVLAYYKNDSLKYCAACYLIENMPRWYSYQGWQLDTLHVLLEKQKKGILSDSVKTRWQTFNYRTLEKVYDAKVITFEYLVNNIEMAFDVWRNCSWNRSLPFSEFCELILPYRIGNERLSNWRSLYGSYYMHLLDSLYTGSDVMEACKIVYDELKRQKFTFFTDLQTPHLDADKLFDFRIGYCREQCDLVQYAMRSCGIPVSTDYMPYSPDYRYSHEWNVVRDTTGLYIPFGFSANKPVRGQKLCDGRRKGKVFRYCYSLQHEREELFNSIGWNIGGEEGKYHKDVTSEYFGTNEVLIEAFSCDKIDIGLAVFSVSGWQVIGEGICQNNKTVLFRNIEPELIYVPVALDYPNRMVGYPFMLHANGKVETLIPDTVNWEEVVLKRKMALIPRVAAWGYSQLGARIEGDNHRSFTNPQLLVEIKDTLNYTYQIFKSQYTEPIKYVRYVPPVGFIQLAELKLYEDSLLTKAIDLNPVTDFSRIENVTDGDILTYTYRKSSSIVKPLVFALDASRPVSRIFYVSRTDDNYVCSGDTYELLYYDGTIGWKSLGSKVALSRTVCFNAPKNALLWLRNKTRGKEEQVFIYRNNRQWFNSDFIDY